jgi:hypothetical protein
MTWLGMAAVSAVPLLVATPASGAGATTPTPRVASSGRAWCHSHRIATQGVELPAMVRVEAGCWTKAIEGRAGATVKAIRGAKVQ